MPKKKAIDYASMFTLRKDGRYMTTWTDAKGVRHSIYSRDPEELYNLREKKIEEANAPLMLDSLLDSWFESREDKARYKTLESYAAPMKEIKAHFEGRTAAGILPSEITDFIRSLERKGYARRTVQLRLDVLRMAFRYGIGELDVPMTNPCDSVRLSRGLPKTTRTLPTKEDIEAIKRHAEDDRFSLLPFFLYCTGMRVGEALAIRKEDFSDDTISITKKVSWQPNQPVIDNFAKTEKGIRKTIYLDVLKSKMPKVWEGYLFSDTGLKPYTKSEFVKRWKKYKERTGVQCDRHQLRHEFATLLYEAGVDVKEAAFTMGHDEKIMREIYTHIRETSGSATQKMNKYIAKQQKKRKHVVNDVVK